LLIWQHWQNPWGWAWEVRGVLLCQTLPLRLHLLLHLRLLPPQLVVVVQGYHLVLLLVLGGLQ
jgi:hypothetical protein